MALLMLRGPGAAPGQGAKPDGGGGTVFSYLEGLDKGNQNHMDRRAKIYRDFILNELHVEDI